MNGAEVIKTKNMQILEGMEEELKQKFIEELKKHPELLNEENLKKVEDDLKDLKIKSDDLLKQVRSIYVDNIVNRLIRNMSLSQELNETSKEMAYLAAIDWITTNIGVQKVPSRMAFEILRIVGLESKRKKAKSSIPRYYLGKLVSEGLLTTSERNGEWVTKGKKPKWLYSITNEGRENIKGSQINIILRKSTKEIENDKTFKNVIQKYKKPQLNDSKEGYFSNIDDPDYLSQSETLKIAEELKKEQLKNRQSVILGLVGYYGFTPSMIPTLKIEDFDSETGILKIWREGKQKSVTIQDPFRDCIKKLCNGRKEGYIVLSREGAQISQGGAFNAVRRSCKKIIGKEISPTVLKNSFAEHRLAIADVDKL